MEIKLVLSEYWVGAAGCRPAQPSESRLPLDQPQCHRSALTQPGLHLWKHSYFSGCGCSPQLATPPQWPLPPARLTVCAGCNHTGECWGSSLLTAASLPAEKVITADVTRHGRSLIFMAHTPQSSRTAALSWSGFMDWILLVQLRHQCLDLI